MEQFSETDNQNDSEWGIYKGKMNWDKAMEEANKLGMRLPTREELLDAYQKGKLKSWLDNGYLFWTSDEFSSFYAYGLYVSSGHSYYYNKTNEWHARFVK
ncbi:MAG TPA: hypothetical protein PK079_08780 [Leptospiraceae bacterium]|nr:hypothetical protein [Leptospiraceae bacterium]HMW04257.1 hypothetical protein [Leptospiraceae bacterium]HMX30603.1 hypothetical protein [Leptospiraceae bacterium]HMY31303.1 hypothetical protein [Leptospiraceae bacterium]HMZ63416.1 hypothetical protein [Leptospiraceae bacterium]